jgi:pantothenate kinase-related protein Tda10
MKYSEAEDIATIYSTIVGKPMLNKLMFLDDRKITSLLISTPDKIKEIYSAWWHNGNDNKQAVTKNKNNKNFQVFLMSYDPSIEKVIYYLRLSKYLELEKF